MERVWISKTEFTNEETGKVSPGGTPTQGWQMGVNSNRWKTPRSAQNLFCASTLKSGISLHFKTLHDSILEGPLFCIWITTLQCPHTRCEEGNWMLQWSQPSRDSLETKDDPFLPIPWHTFLLPFTILEAAESFHEVTESDNPAKSFNPEEKGRKENQQGSTQAFSQWTGYQWRWKAPHLAEGRWQGHTPGSTGEESKAFPFFSDKGLHHDKLKDIFTEVTVWHNCNFFL